MWKVLRKINKAVRVLVQPTSLELHFSKYLHLFLATFKYVLKAQKQ